MAAFDPETIQGSQVYRQVAPASSEITSPKFAPRRMREGAFGWNKMLNSSGKAPFACAPVEPARAKAATHALRRQAPAVLRTGLVNAGRLLLHTGTGRSQNTISTVF